MAKFFGENYIMFLAAPADGPAIRDNKRGGSMVLTKDLGIRRLNEGETVRITVEPGTLAFPGGLPYNTQANGWGGCCESEALTEGSYNVTLLSEGDAHAFARIEAEKA